jgi:hypothetical protein
VPAPKPRKAAAIRAAPDKPAVGPAPPKPSAAKPASAKKTAVRERAAKPAAAKPAATSALSGLTKLFSSSKSDTKPAGDAAKKAEPKAAKPKPRPQAAARQP